MLLATKGGTISAAKLISETATDWNLEVERRPLTISKTDKIARAFVKMSDALKWTGADRKGELIDHFLEKEAAEAAQNEAAAPA
ncbi:hypothetical protein [Pseudomonas sp. EMN2]|uniref:hypothetical protein n=1 Tax=Pseudomonas sp. EMN2 TaxID=2615212 RepID=UPI00129B2DD0|nr:hypothetical protein [Pseudomonas sp. EMN2]